MITTDKLKYLKANLKQELKVESLKLRNKKLTQERRNINRMFKISPKKVYRSLKGECLGPVKEMPTKEEIQNFWSSLWGKPVHHNKNAHGYSNKKRNTVLMPRKNHMKSQMKFLTKY